MQKPIKSYRDLIVWQKSMDLVVSCYHASSRIPDSERYGLTSQLRRSASSVPANIAEGWGRDSSKEYLRFLSIAYGSLVELETHIQIAERLNYMEETKANSLLEQSNEIGKMISGLKKSIQNRL